MSARGKVFPPEWRSVIDPVSGVPVRQLTDYRGNSRHTYFTDPGWYARGRKLLFHSDRDNRAGLFSLCLESGEITRLTVCPAGVEPGRPQLAPDGSAVFYLRGAREVAALDLETLEETVLWTVSGDEGVTGLDRTADGRFVCVSLTARHGSGFRNRVARLPAAGGAAETAWEEESGWYICHLNASPVRPGLFTYCHEGMGDEVDNRIWGLELSGGRNWQIRPRRGEEYVSHEYWLADGEHVAYVGRRGNLHRPFARGGFFFGRVRHDNSDCLEWESFLPTPHGHSLDFSLVAGDFSPHVSLWRRSGSVFEGPRVLCEHRSSAHFQGAHVHPAFSPDGRSVLFTSNRSGYGNLYLAAIPDDFGALPEWSRAVALTAPGWPSTEMYGECWRVPCPLGR